MKETLIQEYNNTQFLRIPSITPKNTIIYNFVDGATCEVNGPVSKNYRIKFFNGSTSELVHESTITNNMWSRTSAKYFIKWRIEVYDEDINELLEIYNYNAKEKRVYIHIDSTALGDSLAWFPYAEEFRKHHGCEVVVSTFHNEWFQDNYPELKFVEPGTVVENLYAMYGVGWHYNDKELDKSKHTK